jgi:hypothetical protein
MALSQSVVLDFKVNNVTPYTTLYPYILDADYSALTIPEFRQARTREESNSSVAPPGMPGDPLTTNSAGSVNGKIVLPKSVVAGLPTNDVTIKFHARKKVGRGGDIDWEGVVATITTKYQDSGTPASTVNTSTATTSTRGDETVTAQTGTSAIPGMSTRSVVGGSNSLAPLAQTFYVDATRYPQGIFISSIELYFAAKDTTAGISIELRNIVDGLPDASQYIAGSVSSLTPTDVSIPSNLVTGPIVPTKFVMTHPIQLTPGEYAICIRSTSDNYSLYYAKLGEYILGTNTILDKESYSGKLYKSQNTNAWLEEKNTDICFRVNKAVFETGTKQFEIQTGPGPADTYHNYYFDNKEYNFSDLTSISYSFKGNLGGGSFTDYTPINGATAIKTTNALSIQDTGDVKIQVSMENKSKDISPIFDMKQSAFYTFKNNIEPYETDTSDSELAYNDGIASSKYISKVTTLENGFDSTGLEVKVAVNRQVGTDIEVFCRVLSPYDSGSKSRIENQAWRRMPLFAQTASTSGANTAVKSYAGADGNSFSIETYKILEGDSAETTGTPNLSYYANVSSGTSQTTSSPTRFDTFNKYQIKIVMYASTIDTYIPKLKGIVATAVV